MGLGNSYDEEDIRRGLIDHVSETTIKTLVYEKFFLPSHFPLPYSYRIFPYFKKPLYIMNMNVDGIASRLNSKGIYVVNAHGQATKDLRKTLGDELFYKILEYEIELPSTRTIWPPEPEPDWITNIEPYKKVINYFKMAKRGIIIGYSFGSHGDYIDDYKTLDLVCRLINFHNLPVFIINPSKMALIRLSILIENMIKPKYIYPVLLYWNIFSKILFFFKNDISSNKKYLCSCWKDLLSYYLKSCDKNRLSVEI